MTISLVEQKYDFHPVVFLFPRAPDSKIKEIADSIEKNGQLESCKEWCGRIIDGRHRIIACEMKGIAPWIEDVSEEVEDPLEYAVALNYDRRQMSETQEAALGADIVTFRQRGNMDSYIKRDEVYERRLKVNEISLGMSNVEVATLLDVSEGTVRSDLQAIREGKADEPPAHEPPPVTIQKAAEMAGSSRSSVARAVAVKESAPELHQALKEDKVSVADAYKIRSEPEATRKAALAQVTSNKAVSLAHGVRLVKQAAAREEATEAAAWAKDEDRIKLFNVPIHSLADVMLMDSPERDAMERESIDVIITDPPYPREFMHVWEGLGNFASHMLKPGGMLVVIMAGNLYIPEKFLHIEDGANGTLWFRCIASYHMQGPPNTVLPQQLLVTKKDLLIYHRRLVHPPGEHIRAG